MLVPNPYRVSMELGVALGDRSHRDPLDITPPTTRHQHAARRYRTEAGISPVQRCGWGQCALARSHARDASGRRPWRDRRHGRHRAGCCDAKEIVELAAFAAREDIPATSTRRTVRRRDNRLVSRSAIIEGRNVMTSRSRRSASCSGKRREARMVCVRSNSRERSTASFWLWGTKNLTRSDPGCGMLGLPVACGDRPRRRGRAPGRDLPAGAAR